MAFQRYRPAKKFADQTWVGFDQFKFLFTDDNFMAVLRNTIGMSSIRLVLGFTTAISLALLLNEVRHTFFKRTIQTITYLPHFLSWVIAAGLVKMMLSVDGGIVNIVLVKLHLIKQPISWLSHPQYFWGIIGGSYIWKELGWNTIIYLAAMASIDPCLYESAEIDGANRYQKMWFITLPGIKSTIMVLLIMSIGWIMEAGFEQQWLFRNPLVTDWSDTIDIFVFRWGIAELNYSLATAAGMFKTLINVILLFTANHIAKRMGEERLV